MNNAFREESYKRKEEKLKKSSNRFLVRFLIIFIVGYSLFFTSRFWLPKTYEGVSVTPIGTTISANERNITIDSWQYSKDQEMMEVILEIENLSIDGIKEYKYQAFDKDKEYKVEKVRGGDGFYVLRIYKVKSSWTELALRIDIRADDKSKNGDFEKIKIYTNDKIVNKVSKLPLKTLKEYKEESYTQQIKTLEKRMAKNRRKKGKYEDSIKTANEKIKELEGKAKYQTKKEQTETAENIGTINQEKKNLEEKVTELEGEYKELQEKIKFIRESLDELNGIVQQEVKKEKPKVKRKTKTGKTSDKRKVNKNKKKVKKQ